MNLVETLVGMEVSAVVFVRDYLQFQLNGPTLTVNVMPRVYRAHHGYDANEPEYRNRLCDLLGKRVLEVLVMEQQMTITFADDVKLFVSREMNVLDLPELIVFEDANGPIIVW